MPQPTKEQFFCLFEKPRSEPVLQTQAALVEHYLDEEIYPGQRSDWTTKEDYLEVFCQIFCIWLDWNDNFFTLLKWLPDRLEEHCEVEFDAAHQSAQLRYAEQLYHFTGRADFADNMAQLQEIFSDRYIIKEVSHSDTDGSLRLLLLPIPLWNQAVARYGAARVDIRLFPYGTMTRQPSPSRLAEQKSATSPPAVTTSRVPAIILVLLVIIACLTALLMELDNFR